MEVSHTKYKISVHSIPLCTIATVTEVTTSECFYQGIMSYGHSGASGMRAEFLKMGNTQHLHTLT